MCVFEARKGQSRPVCPHDRLWTHLAFVAGPCNSRLLHKDRRVRKRLQTWLAIRRSSAVASDVLSALRSAKLGQSQQTFSTCAESPVRACTRTLTYCLANRCVTPGQSSGHVVCLSPSLPPSLPPSLSVCVRAHVGARLRVRDVRMGLFVGVRVRVPVHVHAARRPFFLLIVTAQILLGCLGWDDEFREQYCKLPCDNCRDKGIGNALLLTCGGAKCFVRQSLCFVLSPPPPPTPPPPPPTRRGGACRWTMN